VVRRIHLQHPTPAGLDSTLPALSLAIADVARKTPDRHKKYFQRPGGEMLIDYVGGRECFEFDTNRIVYARVLDLWEPEDFRDKIVVVGETSLQAKEISVTPFGLMPSMQVHANALATLLGRGEPQMLPLWQTALIAWSGSLLLVVPLLRWPLWASFLLAMLQGLTLVFLGAWIFSTWHKVLPASVPLAALALTYNTLALWEYRRARRTLGRFIGDEMVAGTLHPLRELERGGREEIATALFCDMRGYSGLAERLPPAQLTPLTNAYQQIVIDVAGRFGGRAIDFQGDGVFVLFETGLAGEEHAAQAVRAAIVMQASFETLQARRDDWGVPHDDKTPQRLEFGIGIATGVMMIGVLGAQQRLHLGAAGDTVNIAARVEGLTRDFSYPILMAGSTHERVRGLVHATSCGICRLHGRSSTVEVWGVEGLIDQDDSPSPLRNQLTFT
jgi:adenylate cyclase